MKEKNVIMSEAKLLLRVKQGSRWGRIAQLSLRAEYTAWQSTHMHLTPKIKIPI